MTWLLPIGFLGLIGVAFLIAIYLIKPNYQQKYVSTTFVWKLSLKYRRSRLPINRINNIITFVCQLLIITIAALLLARPVIEHELQGDDNEKIIIIDASASMLVSDGDLTRFERAVSEAKTLIADTLASDGAVSVILADSTPEILIQRATKANSAEITEKLDSLIAEGSTACSYSSADMKGAVTLAEEVLRSNSEARVHLYTATEYIEKNGITVHKISSENEWNAAVLDVRAEMNANNHYEISIDLGCYAKTEMVTVYCTVHSANGKDEDIKVNRAEFFDPMESEKTVVFTTDDFGGTPLYSYDYIEAYVTVSDSFTEDNSFFLYGGMKETVRVLYASSKPNNYFSGVVRTIRENMKDRWNIVYHELKAGDPVPVSGYDFYIYEHEMPEVLPTDGFVLLVDPASAPNNSGFRVGEPVLVDADSTLASGTPHELTQHVDSSRVTIAKYNQIISSDGFEELAFYKGKPVMLAKDEPGAKVVIWAFDLNYSNIIALPDFSFLVYNMFNYYIPSTFSSHSYEIGDTVILNARGEDLKVTGNGEETKFDTTPAKLELTAPGTYTVTQRPMQGDSLIIESFFVTIPNTESDISRQIDELPLVSADAEVGIAFEDLLFYFAIALVSLLFVEWVLQIKKNF